MRAAKWTAAAAVAIAPPALAQSNGLAAPVKIEAGGEAISVETGHAAPFVHDFDGDGVNDLLVGQFGGGKLRIYRNHGSDTSPQYRDFEYFKAGHEFGTVPAS